MTTEDINTDAVAPSNIPTPGGPVATPADAENFKAGFDTSSDIGNGSIQDAHLDVILDVPITLSMEVGRSKISIRELLGLNPGAVVKLQRAVGEPMDILVNGCLVARGEVVVVGEQFGIRIADVVSPEERLKTLA
jgi:flagellar motor switch protein FliN